MDQRKKRAISSGAIVLVGLVLLLDWHAVDNSLSDQDRDYIPKYLAGVPAMPPGPQRSYQDEIDFIERAQRAVLDVAPLDEGLPPGTLREPKDLFEAGKGLCFDRSRVIEKILRYGSLETRHVVLYSTRETGSAVESLLTRGISSHAVSEVRTKKGWLVVDSNKPWVSLDPKGSPVSISDIESYANRHMHLTWRMGVPNAIYEEPFVFVYGLYSRHGKFYPPYDFIPDINYSEFVQNVL